MKEENGYIILESKMNHMSLYQLENAEPLTIPLIIKKLTHLANNPNKAHTDALKAIGGILTGDIQENVTTVFKLPRGVFYDATNQFYLGQKVYNGKKYHIKRSRNVLEVVSAVEKFCFEHNLDFK